MRRLGLLGPVLAAMGAGLYGPSIWGEPLGRIDPRGTLRHVSPAPGVAWQPARPLPQVAAPPALPEIAARAPLTLAELTEFALRNNPRARQAWFAARAAAAGVGIEQADLLPQVTAVVGATRVQPVSATTGAQSPPQNRYGPTVSLSYILYDFGARSSRIEAAEYRLLAANLAQNRTLQDVVFQVEQAYYRLLGLELLIRVNELTLQNLGTSLDAAQRRRESGLATIADVYRAETQVAQAQLNLTRSRGEFQKARGTLAAAVGLPANHVLQVQTFPELPEVHQITDTLDDLLARARSTRPDLVAAEAQARAARASATAASLVGLPVVELAGSGAHTLYTDGRSGSTGYNIGINVRIPLFTGYRDRYAFQLAQAQAEQAEAARDTLYRQTELDVWQAYYDVQTAATGVTTTEAQVRSAQQTAEATLARYRAGFGTLLDLITAQQDEANARVQRIQSYLDWHTALARLHFSTGFSVVVAAAGGIQ
jgi:outer membrane protein